ncbi:MAG: hypothetical protein PHO74_04165 [Weeksellaceae bacterium]|jgi:hypothetical protein|nr:hypothetical protein [Weeksellaceae bacterium]
MRNLILYILLIFLLFQCQSKPDVVEEISPKRIHNSTLINTLPELVKLRNETIEDREFNKGSSYIYILTTENHVYAHTSVMDCVDASFYSFSENIDNKNYEIWVDERSIRSERYFDLKDAKWIERDNEVQICDDWYWVKAKFELFREKLKLTKVSTFFDNTYSEETFYDKSDSAFLHEIEFLNIEPEPVPEFQTK